MGNLTSLAMRLAAQDEEDEFASVGSELVEGGAGEEETQMAVSEGEEAQEGGGAKVEEDVEREEQDEPVLQCTICLDAVVASGEERSNVRLQCGHQFHLDCIGSAFNAKGVMQCPNCRLIETGNWRYASGPRSPQDISGDDWVLDEDLDFTPEVFVPLRFQWIPISRLPELPSLFGETEPSSAAAIHDTRGQNFNAESIGLPGHSTTTQGAYLAYIQPLPPLVSSSRQPLPPQVSSSSAHTANGAVDDHSNFLGGPSDNQPLQGVHRIDYNHNPWALIHSYSPPNNNNGVAEQSRLPLGRIRIGGFDSGSQQRGSPLPTSDENGSEWHGIPNLPARALQLLRAPQSLNPRFEQGSSSSSFTRYEPLYGGVGPFGDDDRMHLDWSSLPEGSSDSSSADYWERAQFGPHSAVNEVWASTSQQQQPRGVSEPAPAPMFGHWTGFANAMAPPPSENDRSPH